VDQSNNGASRITKYLPSTALKALVSVTVKLLNKFEGGVGKSLTKDLSQWRVSKNCYFTQYGVGSATQVTPSGEYK